MKKQKKNSNVFNDDNSIRRDGGKKSNSKIAFLFPHDCNKLKLDDRETKRKAFCGYVVAGRFL